ncbi:tetratricopeptide repeat protein, partial [Cognatishimia sp. F0-27]|uniref:tetratricopeptide repeat protein n=1 Tax=Cognatishimia sp. F0-27 TaxID=2816855 RepID=UPI001D0CD181
MLRARILVDLGDPDAAFDILSHCHIENPTDPAVAKQLVALCMSRGDHARAQQVLYRVLEPFFAQTAPSDRVFPANLVVQFVGLSGASLANGTEIRNLLGHLGTNLSKMSASKALSLLLLASRLGAERAFGVVQSN